MMTTIDMRDAFGVVIQEAYSYSADIGREIDQVLAEGKANPLTRDDAHRLLRRVIEVLRRAAILRNDGTALASLEGRINAIVDDILAGRAADEPTAGIALPAKRLTLQSFNGIEPRVVKPAPRFHSREVQMMAGFVRTTDLQLWEENERLDIHLGQFRQQYGRDPDAAELLNIMLSKMQLPGIPDEEREDQFKIVQLARSIAANGVQKPPVVDLDGTLLDGNRRVAACYYILHSNEFDSEQKKRAEYIYAWQLSEFATDEDRDSVVVASNFEPDMKLDWPEYVKARKVFEEWQTLLALEPDLPGPQRQAQMKRDLSKKFALGPETGTVNRYLKMVEWANRFEEYHVGERHRNHYEVKHAANEYFQYFDELAKGANSGGVAATLNQDDAFRAIVFDLLFDGKFLNWRQIRELKTVADNPEAREILGRAANEANRGLGQDHVDNAIAIARSRRPDVREMGANTRIESFVTWLEDLPLSAFRDVITPDNLRRLRGALKLVDSQAAAILGEAS